MSPVEREMHALRALASMPFLDALELAYVSGTAARTMRDALVGDYMTGQTIYLDGGSNAL